jgi:hypothetical protein
MIHSKIASDVSRIVTPKNVTSHPNAPAMQPGHNALPNAAQTAAMASHSGKVAPNTTTTPAHIGNTEPKKAKTKESSEGSTSGRAAARREAHANHPTVGPSGREGRSGGNGGGGSGFGSQQGHQDINDWMPFSAQQSRISRSPIQHRGPALAKVTAHPFHPLKSAVFSLAGRFYSEILPSMFRRTPQQVDQAGREVKKDAVRKSNSHRTERNEVRRNEIRARAEENPKRVFAGDLNRAFAGT